MKTKYILTLCGAALAISVFLAAGCSTTGANSASATEGSRLWAQNCIRCHNSRSPSTFSEAQWDVTMMHMRIRANLTAEEHKAILAFLKSRN